MPLCVLCALFTLTIELWPEIGVIESMHETLFSLFSHREVSIHARHPSCFKVLVYPGNAAPYLSTNNSPLDILPLEIFPRIHMCFLLAHADPF